MLVSVVVDWRELCRNSFGNFDSSEYNSQYSQKNQEDVRILYLLMMQAG